MNSDLEIELDCLKADLAWAVPVRPDLLMASLEAYSNYKDGINAFRLCHRFGRGPDVHVSKLPRELELAIEQFVIMEARNATSDEWVSGFRCLEARCAPVDHSDVILEEMTYGELAGELFHDREYCCKCEEDVGREHCDFDCLVCTKRVEEAINEKFVDEEAIFHLHLANLRNWQKNFAPDGPGRQEKAGKLRKLLLQDFGLSVNAKWHRKAATTDTPWTDDDKHEWHREHEFLTIICYLTLPQRSYITPGFSVTDFETEVMQFADLSVVQSFFVQIPTLAEQDIRVEQFNLALSALNLKPYIHPSQLQGTISAQGDTQMQKEAKENPKDEDKDLEGSSSSDDDHNPSAKVASTPSSVDTEADSWPRLIQIVSASVTASI